MQMRTPTNVHHAMKNASFSITPAIHPIVRQKALIIESQGQKNKIESAKLAEKTNFDIFDLFPGENYG
jgi:hypothetical protein